MAGLSLPMSRAEIAARLRPLLADSLAVPGDAISLQSRLIDDLGADSLDFVDLIFAIEKTFGARLREADLGFLTRLDFTSPEVMRDGVLTAATLERVSPFLPGLASVPDPARVTPRQLFSLLTVESLCIMIERELSKTTS
jgi:acyl carrier protein